MPSPQVRAPARPPPSAIKVALLSASARPRRPHSGTAGGTDGMNGVGGAGSVAGAGGTVALGPAGGTGGAAGTPNAGPAGAVSGQAAARAPRGTSSVWSSHPKGGMKLSSSFILVLLRDRWYQCGRVHRNPRPSDAIE